MSASTVERSLASRTILVAAALAVSQRLFAAVADPWKEQPPRLLSFIQSRLQARQPTSMIRLGDGEGRILGYDTFFSEAEIIRECIQYQFGTEAVDRLSQLYGRRGVSVACGDLRGRMIEALASADAVGLPSPTILGTPVTPENAAALAGYAVATFVALGIIDQAATPIFEGYIFRPMQMFGYMRTLLRGLPLIGIVTPHGHIVEPLREAFSIKEVVHYPAPGHYTFTRAKGESVLYPDSYVDVISNLVVKEQGQLFLVGAGYWGKSYCHAIKQRGGIALDVGSLFDGWMGKGHPDAVGHKQLRLQSEHQ